MRDLNIDQKIRNLKNNNEPNATSTTVNNPTSGIGVIPVGKSAQEDNPITKFINSDEFKTMPREDQLAALKKRFPNLEESQFRAILPQTIKETPELTSEDVAKAIQAPTVQEEDSKEQEEMNALVQVSAEHGIKNPTIDDLKAIYQTLTKKDAKELTHEEKQVLDFMNAISAKENRPQQMMKLLAENAQAIDNIIPKEVLNSKEWKSKTPEEKLYARMEKVLEHLDSNFAKIEDPAQKQAYMKGTLGTFAEMMTGGKEMSDAEKDYHISVVAFLADAAEQKGLTLSKLVGMMQDKNEEGQKELLKLALDIVDDKNLLKEYFDSNNNTRQRPIKNITQIANIMMQTANPEKYAKLTDEEKDRIAARGINLIGSQIYGEEWVQPEEMTLDAINRNNYGCIMAFSTRFSAAKAAGETKIKDIIGTPGDKEFQKKAVQQERDYLKANGTWDKLSQERRGECELTWAVREHYGELSVSLEQTYKYIKSLNKSELNTAEERNIILFDKLTDGGYKNINAERLAKMRHLTYDRWTLEHEYKGDIKKYALDLCGGDKTTLQERLNDPDFIQDLAVIANIKNFDELSALTKELGIDINSGQINVRELLKQITELQGLIYIKTAKVDTQEWKKTSKDVVTSASERGASNVVEDVLLHDATRSKDFNFLQDIGNHANKCNFEANHNIVTKFWRSEKLEKGWGDQFAHNALSSDIYSNDQKQQLTASYQMNAHNDQERITTAKFLSDIDNEGVKRGIIDGQSYLESDSARQEYGNIINEIISSTSDSETRSRLSSYNQEVQANTSSSSSSTSSSNSSGTHNPSSSSGNSGTPKTGSGSGTTSSSQTAAAKAKAQIQQDYAQAVTKALQLQKEQAMKKLVQITENYQKSVKEREEKKAKEAQAQKTDSTKTGSSSGSKASNVSEKKSSDEIAETFTTSASASSSISEEKREELRQAYQSGGAASLYEKLGSVSTTYQEQFLNYFAQHANTADLCSFASSHSGNKNVILTLYQRSNDPALLQYLGEANIFDLLGKGKIKLQDFLRYATPDMVAKYLQNMQQVGNLNAIKEVTSMMSLTQREEISQGFIEQAENKAPVPGSDEWLKAQQENMADASIATPEQNDNQKISGGAMLSLDDEKENSTSAMLSLNDDENDFGGSFGSNKVRMGLDIKKRDKRFYRMG